MSFADDVKKWNEQLMIEIDENVRDVAMDLLGDIQQRTPVDQGELRKSWTLASSIDGNGYIIATDKPYAHVLEYGLYPDPVKHGSRVSSGGGTKYSKKNPTTVWLQKSLGGYSMQAPQGFVRLAMVDILAKWRPKVGYS